jgi:hypothetical protein
MSRFSSTYPTGRSTHVCAATGRALTDGERCIAALVEDRATGRLGRLDFATESWDGGARPDPTATRLVGSWRTKVASRGESPKAVLDEESLLELLSQIEPGDPRRDGVRLVVALLLLRCRALVQDGHKPGRMLLRRRGEARPPDGPPLIEVTDTGLDEAAIHEVMGELEPLLGGEPSNGIDPASPAAGASATGGAP